MIKVRVEQMTDAKKGYFLERLMDKNVTIDAIKTYDPSNSSRKNSSSNPIMSENS